MNPEEARQKDIDDGIWCESYRSHEGNDWCVKGHVTCMGKLCMDYRPEMTDAAIEPLPYKVKTTNNEYGELRVEGVQP